MKRFTKALSMLLAIIMVVGLLPLTVISEDIQSTHTVQFKLNYNGAHRITSQKVKDGECAVQPEGVAREGWLFEYWYVKTGDGIQRFDLTQPITEDVTLYARWDEDPAYWGRIWNRNILGSIANVNKNVTYTVTFDGNGENVENIPDAQNVNKGECAVEPSDPTRSGYYFGGWYTNAAGTVAYDFAAAVNADITLYAKWASDTIISDTENYIYIPNEKNASYDSESSTLYYNNLINIFTYNKLNNNQIDRLCDLVDGTLVGNISQNINFIQIRIDAVDYSTMSEKIELLNAQAEVLYAYHEIPLDITSNSTNPWSSNANSPESDRGNENVPDGNDWWAEAIGAYTSWEYNSHIDETVTVGIIDNGFDVDHEDLTGKIEFLDNYRTNSEADHGTHVAGLISANNNSVGLRGVCDTAQLLCADWTPNTEDSDSSNYRSLLGTGEYILIISDMISDGAKVINNSWGNYVQSYSAFEELKEAENKDSWWDKLWGDYKTEYQEYLNAVHTSAEETARVCAVLIAELINSGNNDFFIIQSAGNGWDNAGPGYIAFEYRGFFISITEDVVNSIKSETLDGITFEDIDDHILIVAAAKNVTVLFGNAHLKYNLTSFSNYGESVDIAAPGYDIFSTICNNRYANFPGTSMAAPIVAGAVAQIWSINPELSVSDIRDYLFDNSVEDAYGVGDGKDFSYPMLNIGEAVKAVIDDKYSNKGYIIGILYDSETLNGINGAKITCYNDDFEFSYVAYSEIDGTIRAKANIPSNIRNCDIKIEKAGYKTKVIYDLEVENRGIDLQNIALDSIGGCNITGVITIADTDTDMTNNLPLEGAEIVIPLTGYMDAVDTTNARGEYTITDLPLGTYNMTVSRDGYIPVTETIVVDGTATELIYNITIEAIPEEYQGIGFASGTIYDVATGSPVSGLTLYIREGLNNTTGNVVLTQYMNNSGTYSTTIGLPAGNYTVQVVDERTGITEEERYITSSFNIKILGGMTVGNQHGYVSNSISSEEIRIVLTWGSTPSDLDSHLVGPTADGGKFHVYYGNKRYGSEADLDVDDTSSYGPETITIHSFNDGIYTYAIHDYSNRYSSYSTALSNSGAQINVYRGAALIATYNVPANMDGTLWTVFTYNPATKQITTVNTMSYDSSSGGSLMNASAPMTLMSADDDVSESESEDEEYDYEEIVMIISEDILCNIKD